MKKPELSVKETLTVDEAATLFNLSRRKFKRLIEESDRLPFMAAYKARRLVIRCELEKYFKTNPAAKEALKNGPSKAPKKTGQ